MSTHLTEALTSEQRGERVARTRLRDLIQYAIERGLNKLGPDAADAGYNQKARVTALGDMILSIDLSGDTFSFDDAAIKSLTRFIAGAAKRSGVHNIEFSVRSIGDGARRLSVIVDRGTVVMMGGINKNEAKMRQAMEDHDVTTPITSRGSTKGPLPKPKQSTKNKKAKNDEDEGGDEDIFESFVNPTDTKSIDVSGLKYEGETRFVRGARMLWKSKEEDGTFTERWMYLAQSIDDIVRIKRDILSGTDIPVTKTQSPDGRQGFVMEQYGDCVFLTINGLSV